MYPGDPGPLGGECAGTIVAIGENVEGLHVGDEVITLAPGSFSTFVTVNAALVADIEQVRIEKKLYTLPSRSYRLIPMQ